MCDCNIIRSTNVTVVGGVIIITIPPTIFRNKERRCLVVCQPFPAPIAGTNPLIFISNNGVLIPTLNKIGNFVRANQITCRRKYEIVFGNDPLHISFLSGLTDLCPCPCSGDDFIQTTIAVTNVAEQAAVEQASVETAPTAKK